MATNDDQRKRGGAGTVGVHDHWPSYEASGEVFAVSKERWT